MRRIAIYGAGNFGKYIFKELEKTNKYEPIVYIDNNVNGHDWNKPGLPVVDVNLFQDDWQKQVEAIVVAVENFQVAQEMVMSLLPWFKKDIFVPDRYVFGG